MEMTDDINSFDMYDGSSYWEDNFDSLRDEEDFGGLNLGRRYDNEAMEAQEHPRGLIIEQDGEEEVIEHLEAPMKPKKLRKFHGKIHTIKDLPPDPDMFDIFKTYNTNVENEEGETYMYKAGRRLYDGKFIPNGSFSDTVEYYSLEIALGLTLVGFLLILLFVSTLPKSSTVSKKKMTKKQRRLMKLELVQ